MAITIYFKKLGQKEDRFPTTIYIKYFATLAEALESFNEQTRRDISVLYNEFGQVIPLTYNIQKTGLEVYFLEDSE